MDWSGIIFVVLALAWAVYLVPKALQHHDEAARTRSVDRFSNAMRVLARREPVDRRSARLVVTPPRTGERVLVPQRVPSVAARRAAARTAARRRRHVLFVLLGATAVVATLAGLGLLPWWGVAVPAALVVLFLFLARSQVRRESDLLWGTPAVAPRETEGAEDARVETPAPRRAIRVEASYGTVQASRAAAEVEFSADEDTVQLPMEELHAVAVSVETLDGGSLWDPLPVTLPTYVNKARAARTVRTIDLGAPGSWTSGRDEADTALVEQDAASEAAVTDEATTEQARAVGS